jgi:regulator of nucleoside diphosphate kinase
LLNKETEMREDPIIISEADIARLRGLLAARRGDASLNAAHVEKLRSELDRAIVVAADLVPRDVITMGSRVQIRDSASGGIEDYLLVYPREADPATNRLSILAPLGTALLGNAEGDDVQWRMPGGVRSFRVRRVMQDAGTLNADVKNDFRRAPAVASSFA